VQLVLILGVPHPSVLRVRVLTVPRSRGVAERLRRGPQIRAVGFDFGSAAPFGFKGAGFVCPSKLQFPRSPLGIRRSEFYSLPFPRNAPNCSKASPSGVPPVFFALDSHACIATSLSVFSRSIH